MIPIPQKPTGAQNKAMVLYADLLEEAKLRLTVLENALNGKILMSGPFLHETCFLQLRFLCELIALGCLVVHGDIEATQKGQLFKTWSAEEIITKLEQLHPAFYPVPHTHERTSKGAHLTPLESGFLTKEELVNLYIKCGTHLHRGSLKKILKTPQPTQFNFPDIYDAALKIGKLLSEHRISLFQEGTLLLVVLRNIADNERVQIAFAAAQPLDINFEQAS